MHLGFSLAFCKDGIPRLQCCGRLREGNDLKKKFGFAELAALTFNRHGRDISWVGKRIDARHPTQSHIPQSADARIESIWRNNPYQLQVLSDMCDGLHGLKYEVHQCSSVLIFQQICGIYNWTRMGNVDMYRCLMLRESMKTVVAHHFLGHSWKILKIFPMQNSSGAIRSWKISTQTGWYVSQTERFQLSTQLKANSLTAWYIKYIQVLCVCPWMAAEM